MRRRPLRFPPFAAFAIILAFTLAATTPATAFTFSAGLLHHDNLGPSTGERLRDLAFTTASAAPRLLPRRPTDLNLLVTPR